MVQPGGKRVETPYLNYWHVAIIRAGQPCSYNTRSLHTLRDVDWQMSRNDRLSEVGAPRERRHRNIRYSGCPIIADADRARGGGGLR